MRVELVSHLPKGSVSGIGRYVEELHRQLQEQIDVTITQGIDPPLAERFPILHNFPIGVKDHRPGSIVHYTQIMGCAQMLWNPVRPAVATVHDLGMLVWPQEAMMFNRIDRPVSPIGYYGPETNGCHHRCIRGYSRHRGRLPWRALGASLDGS